MARDYARIVRALRAKAADPVVSDHERRALLDRAAEIEKNHPEIVSVKSTFTDSTTTTSRDGRWWSEPDYTNPWMYDQTVRAPGGFRFTKPNPKPGEDPEFDKRTRQAWDELWRLHRQQGAWNRPPDVDDIYEENYKYDDPGPDDDEDYGYDIFEGDEYE